MDLQLLSLMVVVLSITLIGADCLTLSKGFRLSMSPATWRAPESMYLYSPELKVSSFFSILLRSCRIEVFLVVAKWWRLGLCSAKRMRFQKAFLEVLIPLIIFSTTQICCLKISYIMISVSFSLIASFSLMLLKVSDDCNLKQSHLWVAVSLKYPSSEILFQSFTCILQSIQKDLRLFYLVSHYLDPLIYSHCREILFLILDLFPISYYSLSVKSGVSRETECTEYLCLWIRLKHCQQRLRPLQDQHLRMAGVEHLAHWVREVGQGLEDIGMIVRPDSQECSLMQLLQVKIKQQPRRVVFWDCQQVEQSASVSLECEIIPLFYLCLQRYLINLFSCLISNQ